MELKDQPQFSNVNNLEKSSCRACAGVCVCSPQVTSSSDNCTFAIGGSYLLRIILSVDFILSSSVSSNSTSVGTVMARGRISAKLKVQDRYNTDERGAGSCTGQALPV